MPEPPVPPPPSLPALPQPSGKCDRRDLRAGQRGLAGRPPGLPLRRRLTAAARTGPGQIRLLVPQRRPRDGNQLIRADYVAAATSPKGSSANHDNWYGWHWLVAYAGDDRTFFARGYGGQLIYVAPTST